MKELKANTRMNNATNILSLFCYRSTTGWSSAPDEKATKYRLTIKDIQQQESGTYTCTSPRGLTNSIVIIVASNLYVPNSFSILNFIPFCLHTLYISSVSSSLTLGYVIIYSRGRELQNRRAITHSEYSFFCA